MTKSPAVSAVKSTTVHKQTVVGKPDYGKLRFKPLSHSGKPTYVVSQKLDTYTVILVTNSASFNGIDIVTHLKGIFTSILVHTNLDLGNLWLLIY